MIDSDFIAKYTTALYSTHANSAPSYSEFRDMFSSGQLKSKEWILGTLDWIGTPYTNERFIVVGAWYGTLGILLKKKLPGIKLTFLDIDKRCKAFIDNIIYNDPDLNVVTDDMFSYTYTEDVIVNTSCEHIKNIKEWLSLLPKGSTVILQSNNFKEGEGHINCVDSLEEFKTQTGIKAIMFAGELVLPMYTRYMIIGKIC